MHTAVVEIEAILNSRPLFYVGPDDLDETLTPSHLLTGHRILSLSYHKLEQCYSETLATQEDTLYSTASRSDSTHSSNA